MKVLIIQDEGNEIQYKTFVGRLNSEYDVEIITSVTENDIIEEVDCIFVVGGFGRLRKNLIKLLIDFIVEKGNVYYVNGALEVIEMYINKFLSFTWLKLDNYVIDLTTRLPIVTFKKDDIQLD